MLFKNLVFQRLPQSDDVPPDFEDQLAGRTLRPCGPSICPAGAGSRFTNGTAAARVNQQLMIALGVDEKLLPGSIVGRSPKERAHPSPGTGFPVGRKQMRDLRARVADELPPARSRGPYHACLDRSTRRMVCRRRRELPRAEMVSRH